ALSLLGLWSCQRELLTVNDLDLTLRPGLVVPLGQIDLTLGDVFNPDSSLVTTDADQTYRLVYRQTDLLNVGVAEFLELPSQPAIAENFKAGYIALPDVNAAANVRFGRLARSITNPAGFATTLTASHGSTAPIPALPAQNPGNLATTTISSFSTASFHSGTMTLKAVNHYPVAINATVVLANAAGQPLLTYGLGTVPAGDSVSVPASLAGKIVPSQLQFNLTSFSSSGAGTIGIPSTYVPIDTNANLELSLQGSDLFIYSATAQTQTQTLVDDTLNLSFTAPAGVRITELALSQGQLNYSITSAVPEPLSIVLQFPSGSVGGQALQQTIALSPGLPATGSISFQGAVLNLASNLSHPYNELPIRYSATLLSSGQLVTLDSASGVAMSFTLANVEFAHAKGFFGQQSVSIPTDTLSLDLDFVNRLGGSVVFAEPKVQLAITNSLGLPITLDLNVSSYDLTGTAQPLGIPPTVLPYPLTATQFGQTVQDSLTFDKSNTSIVDFFTLPKQRFTFGGQVQINADTLATGVQNFVTGTSAISADVLMELPFYFTAQGIGLTDSIDLGTTLSALDTVVNQLGLQLETTTTLPLNTTLSLTLFDEAGQVVFSDQLDLLVSGQLDAATGLVVAPSTNTTVLVIDASQVPNFARGRWLQLTGELGTGTAAGSSGHPVKLLSDAQLLVRLGLILDFNIEVL
ncbi:MAG: hypothetical protein NWS34_05960, partial [Schleiferiaceae bacterium]|nr:hypothetical protein [Schleiferiaceae bacterium]